MFLAGTLAVAIAAGGAAAVWRGERDRIIDDAVQLQRFGLPVLGSIRAATTAAERRLEQVARRNLGLACLGLLGLFGSLATAEALDLLAPLRVSWLG